jgi:CBS domain-containing protein
MGKHVKDAMTPNPCTIDADQSVVHAAKMMRDEDVGVAPVVESGRLIGTLTDRDIVTRVVAEGTDPKMARVREFASTDLITVDPEQNLDEALRLMAQHQVRRLPVVEEGGRVVGVLAQADVAEEAKPKQVGELVEEISRS